ncbi:Zinc finger MYND domain-containing protein 10, partial [Entophlyctis luteolus]
MSEKQALARQHQELTFCISVTALSIFRYITDHCMDIPLAVLTRILNTNNAVGMLVELVERAPWIQTSKCSRGDTVYSIFADGAWRFVDADEMQRLGKVEAQVWIALYNLLLDNECRRKFNYTDGKKATVLKLRPYIDETLVDQLPVLAHLQRYLDELLIMEISTWALDESFLVEEVAE